MFHAFPHACENDHCHQEANAGTKSIDQCLTIVFILCQNQLRNAQHGAVGGNQRQVNAKCLIQSRHGFFQDGFNQLHQRCNDQNEHNHLQVLHVVGLEQVLVDWESNRSGNKHNRDNSHAHAGCGVQLLETPRNGQIPRNLLRM